MKVTERLAEITLYSASVLAAANLPGLPAGRQQPAPVSQNSVEQSVMTLERSLAADTLLAESVIDYYRAEREHILTVNETRRDFLANELITINTNATVALYTAEQTEKLLLLNKEHLTECAERLKSVRHTQKELESLKVRLERSLNAEEETNKSRTESLSSVRTALNQIENRLIPEARREQKRVRQSLKEACAILYSVTSKDKSFSASDLDDKLLDSLIDDVVSGKTSLQQFEQQLNRQFPNGLKIRYQQGEKRGFRDKNDRY